ncbi:TPA: DUF1472 domain-containing protein [Escherichia coli]|nr:DUF1472 domain-containing protein [Escherichia coli]
MWPPCRVRAVPCLHLSRAGGDARVRFAAAVTRSLLPVCRDFPVVHPLRFRGLIRDVLDTDVPDSECVFAVVLTRGDVRHIAQDWNLSDDELETVMQRLDDAFEYGADVSIVHDVVRELMEEKRASRQVTVPAVMLEKVMALAGSEMKRLYAVGSENGGDGDAFVREEREAMDVVLQALDGEHMS